ELVEGVSLGTAIQKILLRVSVGCDGSPVIWQWKELRVRNDPCRHRIEAASRNDISFKGRANVASLSVGSGDPCRAERIEDRASLIGSSEGVDNRGATHQVLREVSIALRDGGHVGDGSVSPNLTKALIRREEKRLPLAATFGD